MKDDGQASLAWRKSTASNSGDCVEVAFRRNCVLVRNSRDPSGSVLSFTMAEWLAFLVGARDGQFDGPNA